MRLLIGAPGMGHVREAGGWDLREVVLNGGCWAQVPIEGEECEAKGGYVFKRMCYLAIITPTRSPTSSPSNKQRSTNP